MIALPGTIRRKKPAKRKRKQVTCYCSGWWFPHRRGSLAKGSKALTDGCNHGLEPYEAPGDPRRDRWPVYAAFANP